MSGKGLLLLVTGPSGAGKDTLIAGAARALTDRQEYHFARRLITRPPSEAEQSVEISPEEFDRREAEDAFSLSWRAHGYAYAISADTERCRCSGNHVVANVSRTVVDFARGRLQPMHVLHVTARPEVLAARLGGRGRETETDIASRLARAGSNDPEGADVSIVDNSGTVEEGITQFVAAIRDATERVNR